MPNLVQITQRKISIGDKYTISVNGNQVLKGSRSILKLYPKISVSAIQGGPVLYEVEQRMAIMFHTMFIFHFGQNRYELNTVSWWNRHFRIYMGKDVFEIYGHRGRKVSIFLNGRQIAWFQSSAVTFMAGDSYNIHADSAVSVDWLVAIALFWDAAFNRRGKGLINIQFGWLFQAREFDKHWMPA